MANSSLLEARLGPGSSGIDLLVANGPAMIELVREARLDANHYDDFNVGAMAVASSAGAVGYFTAANQNLAPGDNPSKVCAEQIALAKVEHHRFTSVDALITVGPVQADTQSGILTPTLHCCGLCRDCMSRMTKIQPDMPVITVHPTKDLYEWNTLEEMMAIHRRRLSPALAAIADPGFVNWRKGAENYGQWLQTTLGKSVPRNYLAKMAVTGNVDSGAYALPAARRVLASSS